MARSALETKSATTSHYGNRVSDLTKAGKYEIQGRIGEGGFGVVYLGRDPFIKRQVAIKTCSSESDETRRRFLREAEIAGNIEHPNITVLYDFGYEDEVPYLVQEFLTGEDLDHKIARKDSLSFAAKLDILLQAAQGLGFAHENGITHRDIKPSNIRVLDDGRVKIMDFGIAKITSVETQLTQTGTTLGTPAYLSPEQLRGDTVDQRSDIYSYGVLAFELLTYRRLFTGDSISSLFYQILNEAPTRLSKIWPSCPEQLDLLIARCVEKDPKKRISSFRDVITVLQKIAEEAGTVEGGIVTTVDLEMPDLGGDEEPTGSYRLQAVTQARNEIEELMASGHLKQAVRVLLDARETYGDSVPFQTLQERLVQMRTLGEDDEELGESDEVTAALDEARALLDEGQLEQAEEHLAAARARFGDRRSIEKVARWVKVQRKIAEGRSFIERGLFDEASGAFNQARELDPENPEISGYLRQVEAGVLDAGRKERSRGLEAEARNLLSRKQLQQALTRARQAVELDSSNSGARQLVTEIRAALSVSDLDGEATVIGSHDALASEAPTTFVDTGSGVLSASGTIEAPIPAGDNTAPVTTEVGSQSSGPVSAATPPPTITAQTSQQAAAAHGGGRGKLWIGLAAGLVIMTVGLLAWLASSRFGSGSGPAASATLVLHAVPWAQITEVVDAEGVSQLGTEPLFTPASLALPAGSYRVTLTHPEQSEPTVLEVQMGATGTLTERVVLQDVDVDQYFAEVGWSSP